MEHYYTQPLNENVTYCMMQISYVKLVWKFKEQRKSKSGKRKREIEQRLKSQLTPHVVMTGSLKTLQHNWQHSFTDGCSAKTWGSYKRTHTPVVQLQTDLSLCFYMRACFHAWFLVVLGVIPCPPPLHAGRTWNAGTCWTRNGAIGLRWLNLTSEEFQ